MAHDRTALIRQLIATHDGEPWYGSSRMSQLKGLRYTEAAAQPVPGGHSIWALVLHMTAWTNEVRRRVNGQPPTSPVEGDWPAVTEVSASAWEAARQALTTSHLQLVAALKSLPESRWSDAVGDTHNPALGTGLDVEGMVVGLAQHDAYHSGQIATLLRAAGLK
jgi:uncharacterized damage-inducible protein DinB